MCVAPFRLKSSSAGVCLTRSVNVLEHHRSSLISSRGTQQSPTGALVAAANRWYGNRHPPDAAVRRPTRFPNVRRIDVTAGRCVTSRRNMRADILLSVAERRPETYFYFRLENDYDFSRSSY